MAKILGFEVNWNRGKSDVAVDLTKSADKTGGGRELSPSEQLVYSFLKNTQTSRTTYVGVEDLGFKARQQLFYSRRARLDNLYTLAFSVTQIRTAILNIRNEIFRRGFDEFKPAFGVKCTDKDCGKEFEDRREKCTCGQLTREPDPKQLVHFERLMEQCNAFGQTLEDVLREAEDDSNIADDSFILLIKEYVFEEAVDKPVLTKIVQIVRLDPCNLEFDLDTNGIPERAHFICLLHRDDMEQARIAPSLTGSQP